MSCKIKEFLIPAAVTLFVGMLIAYTINMIALLIASWVSETQPTTTLWEQVAANAVSSAYIVGFELGAALISIIILLLIEKYQSGSQTGF